ncbi:hypothetical protein STENM223S_06310 [Streptomyces tendae]
MGRRRAGRAAAHGRGTRALVRAAPAGTPPIPVHTQRSTTSPRTSRPPARSRTAPRLRGPPRPRRAGRHRDARHQRLGQRTVHRRRAAHVLRPAPRPRTAARDRRPAGQPPSTARSTCRQRVVRPRLGPGPERCAAHRTAPPDDASAAAVQGLGAPLAHLAPAQTVVHVDLPGAARALHLALRQPHRRPHRGPLTGVSTACCARWPNPAGPRPLAGVPAARRQTAAGTRRTPPRRTGGRHGDGRLATGRPPRTGQVVAEELRRHTGLPNHELPTEMTDSRDAVAALLTARARATPPQDPYLRSEQALITGHTHHPAPKARGGGPHTGWLPDAPEAHARFPLTLLGVREDCLLDEGDTAALDRLDAAPPGYRLLAHPWQLDLTADNLAPAFADGRLVRLGARDARGGVAHGGRPHRVRARRRPVPEVQPRRAHHQRRPPAVAARPGPPARHRHGRTGRLRRRPGGRGLAERPGGTAPPTSPWSSWRSWSATASTAVLAPGATPCLAAALVEGFDGDPLGRIGPARRVVGGVPVPGGAPGPRRLPPARGRPGGAPPEHADRLRRRRPARAGPLPARGGRQAAPVPAPPRRAAHGCTRRPGGAAGVLPGRRQSPDGDRRRPRRPPPRPRPLLAVRAELARHDTPRDPRPADRPHPARQDQPPPALDRRGRRRRPLPAPAQPAPPPATSSPCTPGAPCRASSRRTTWACTS